MRYIPKTLDTFNDLFQGFFDDGFFSSDSKMMKTDILEKDGNYLMNVELPGFNKEDIKVDMQNGYITISASHNDENEEKDASGNIIRQERYRGSCSRSFYVGDNYKPEDIRAKYENGELKLLLPKVEETKEVTNSISIE